MPLLFITCGESAVIERINGTQDVKQHLQELGFISGSVITVIQKISTGLIVKVKESRIAVDKAMASKIICHY